MCGIAGYFSLDASHALVDGAAILASLRQRGPDANGEMRLSLKGGGGAWLGHTRLSILDLTSAGQQPMTSRDGRWLITFNGEIYNHLDLRKQLANSWRGHSDTETLVEALSQWGLAGTISKLNGMFAFAAVDHQEQKLYLVRDQYGIKPLYFSSKGGRFAFCSELRGLRQLSKQPFAVDREALQTYLTLRYVPSPSTLIEGLQRLEPGHTLEIDFTGLKLIKKPHVYAPIQKFSGNFDDATQTYLQEFHRSVERQLLSDVPIGILLSAGIDSAMVAASARHLGRRLPCYSIGFEGSPVECELEGARHTAEVLGLPFTEVRVGPEDIWRSLRPSLASVEEPLGTTSILPMWNLIQRARQDVEVVLTGQGGDEPLGGYRRYQGVLWSDHGVTRALSGLAPTGWMRGFRNESLWRAIRGIAERKRAKSFRFFYELFDDVDRLHLSNRADCGDADRRIQYWLDVLGGENSDATAAMMAVDMRMNLPDDLLLYGDKVSMAHSLETRVPMLDFELVRFVESLPRQYRTAPGRGKIVHKRAARLFLPSDIINRPKLGFEVPFSEWIRGAWRDRVASLIAEKGCALDGLLNLRVIRALLSDHCESGRNRGRQIFALLSLAIWIEQNASIN